MSICNIGVHTFSNGQSVLRIDQPNRYILWRFMWWLGDAPPNYDHDFYVARYITAKPTGMAYWGSFGTIAADRSHDQAYHANILRPDFHCQWFFERGRGDGTSEIFRLDRLSVEQHYNMILANMSVEIELDMNQRNGIVRFKNQEEAISQGYSFPNKRKDTDASPYPNEQTGIKWRNAAGQVSVPVWLDEYEDVKPRNKGNRSFVGMVVQMYPPQP